MADKQKALCVILAAIKGRGKELEGKMSGDKSLGHNYAADLCGCSTHPSYLCHPAAASLLSLWCNTASPQWFTACVSAHMPVFAPPHSAAFSWRLRSRLCLNTWLGVTSRRPYFQNCVFFAEHFWTEEQATVVLKIPSMNNLDEVMMTGLGYFSKSHFKTNAYLFCKHDRFLCMSEDRQQPPQWPNQTRGCFFQNSLKSKMSR